MSVKPIIVVETSFVAVSTESDISGDQIFVICDDCREAYPDPPYYLFETEACVTTEDTPDGSTDVLHMNTQQGCTGNMCPDCAGPGLMPDDELDPRSVYVG